MPETFDFDTVIERRGTGSSKWSRYPGDVLAMWVADMDFASAPAITAALRRRLDHPVLGYSVARDELRHQIVGDMARKYGWTIAPEDIVFLPGVEPGFNMALKAFLSPGDGVIVETPVYRPILNAPGHWGLERIDVELRAGEDGRYRTDLDAFAGALGRAGAFLLCNPHNPTGKVYDREELTAIAGLCMQQGLLVIADEIHCEVLFDGRTHVPFASLGEDVAKRTITLMSASKAYNIAGLKTGFAIIPDAAMRERFNAFRLGMVDSVNAFGLEATLAAYRDASAWREAAVAYLQANRDYLVDEIGARLPEIRIHRPEATFLAWLDCTAMDIDVSPQQFFLEKAKVGLSAGSDFGAAFGRFARLNFGCCRAVLRDALDRMCEAVRSAR